MKSIAFLLIALFLTGCATDYAKYAEATSKAATAKALEKPALAEQLAKLAGDDPAARVAAIMAIAFMDKQPVKDEAVQIEAPYSVGKFLRDLTGLAVPLASVGSNFYAAKKGADIAIAAQNASRDIALGDQRARVDSLSVVSNGNTAIATGGLSALRGQSRDFAGSFREALARPTTQVTVNGNSNTVAGRDATTTTTTNTVDCVTTQTNRSGDPAGGNGGTNGNAGTTSAAAATATLAKECVAGK